MTTETAPNPYEGAASVSDAADALLRKASPAKPSPETGGADEEAEEGALPAAEEEETPTDEESDADPADSEEQEDPQGQSPTYKVKVGGEEIEVTLEDLKKGYMMGADYGRKAREVAEARKAVIAERQEAMQSVQQQMQELGFLSQTFMQQLVQGEQETNWQELRQTNPAEYAARMYDMEQRRALLQRAFAANQAAQAQAAQIQKAQMEQVLAEEAELTVQKIPDWLDEKVANAEKTAIAKILVSNGYSKEEIEGLSDHRFLVLARKAMLYDQLTASKQEAKTKLSRPVPQVTRGGINPPSGKQTRVDQATQRLRTDRSTDAAAAWLLARTGA